MKSAKKQLKKEKEYKIKSIDFPGGKINLLNGYSGEFTMEFYNKGETIMTQKEISWECVGVRDEVAQYSIEGETAYIEVPKSLIDFLLSQARREERQKVVEEMEKISEDLMEYYWPRIKYQFELTNLKNK